MFFIFFFHQEISHTEVNNKLTVDYICKKNDRTLIAFIPHFHLYFLYFLIFLNHQETFSNKHFEEEKTGLIIFIILVFVKIKVVIF